MEPKEISNDSSPSSHYSFKTLISILAMFTLVLGVVFGVAKTNERKTLSNRAAEPAQTTAVAAPTPGVGYVFDKAAKFTKGESYIYTGAGRARLNPKGPMTMQMWMKLDEDIPATESYYILYKLAEYNYPGGKTLSAIYYIQLYEDKITILINDTNKNTNAHVSYFYPTGDKKVGVWHHIAGVYDGTKTMLFIDGVKLAERNMTTSSVNYPLADDNLPIVLFSDPGAWLQGKGKSAPITIDDVVISTGAQYRANFTVPQGPIQSGELIWHMDEIIGSPMKYIPDSGNGSNYGYMKGDIQLIDSTIRMVPNDKPVLSNITTTSSLPSGRIGMPYKGIIIGSDKNMDNNVKAQLTGLPPTLTYTCTYPKTATLKQVRCTITGTPTALFDNNISLRIYDGLGGEVKTAIPLVIGKQISISPTP